MTRTMTTIRLMADKTTTFQPLLLNGPKGWILHGIGKSEWGNSQNYIYTSPDYPHLQLEIVEKFQRKSLYDIDEQPKKSKSFVFVAKIKKRFGFQNVLFMESFPKFSHVFSSPSFKTTLKFHEEREKQKENVDDKTNKFWMFGPEETNEKKTLDWFNELTNGRKVKWYSNYDCIVYPDLLYPPLKLEEGSKNFILYKTELKQHKLYVHFSSPIKAHEDQSTA